jgi:hypothetical protein
MQPNRAGKSWAVAIYMHERNKALGQYDVPCNGCTLCCQGDAIRILPHEDASKWKTEPHDRMHGQMMLAHKPNGDCVYLGQGECTIQDDKPQMCYEMDCRTLATELSWTKARKLQERGMFKISVWRRGKDLLKLA